MYASSTYLSFLLRAGLLSLFCAPFEGLRINCAVTHLDKRLALCQFVNFPKKKKKKNSKRDTEISQLLHWDF